MAQPGEHQRRAELHGHPLGRGSQRPDGSSARDFRRSRRPLPDGRLRRWAPHRGRPSAAVSRAVRQGAARRIGGDRKSTRLNSSHGYISYAVFCLKKKKHKKKNYYLSKKKKKTNYI